MNLRILSCYKEKFELRPAFTCAKEFSDDTTGNIAVTTAVLGLPILLIVSMALDSYRVTRDQSAIQSALDAAALAAVAKGSVDLEEREAYAKDVFYANYDRSADVQLSAISKEERVTVTADARIPTLFSSAINRSSIEFEKSATAELVKESVTCLLVLSKDKKKALHFKGNAAFKSPNCAIQVNSRHKKALWSDSSIAPIARDICVTGGAVGKFDKHIKTDCRPVEDPYKDKVLPKLGPCISIPEISLETPARGASHYQSDVMVSHITEGSTILPPGNYCGGIRLNGKVKLSPGIYDITNGALVFGKKSTVHGEGVTFVLRGEKARLHMQDDVKVDITASRDGELGGIAFYQEPSGAEWPFTESLVRSGGDVNINGVFYFPKSELRIYGTSKLGANAKATSFVADTLRLNSDVVTTISVDHQAAGLPPLFPRTDEGARLIGND